MAGVLVGSGLKVAGTRVASRFHSVSGWAVGRLCLYAVNALEVRGLGTSTHVCWGCCLGLGHVQLQQWGSCLCFRYAFAWSGWQKLMRFSRDAPGNDWSLQFVACLKLQFLACREGEVQHVDAAVRL